MKVNGVNIDDTYAEAFPVYVARVLITGATTALAETAAIVATGFATSVIGCSAEAGIDRYVLPHETPDGRPGVIIMVVHPSKKQIKSNLIERIGECVLTAATTAVFNALESEDTVPVKLHFFGDGYESVPRGDCCVRVQGGLSNIFDFYEGFYPPQTCPDA